MKQFLVLLTLIIQGCLSPTDEKTASDKGEIKNNYGHVKLNVVVDRSTSYVRSYAFPDPELFKPLSDKISQTATLDFRYGCVFSNSNIQFDRYYVPYVNAGSRTDNANPWLQEAKPKTVSTKQTDWNDFAERVRSKISLPSTKRSDVSSAINHAIVSLSEKQYAGNTDNVPKPRKILLLCTDFKDSFKKTLPTIPAGIEVICVGVLPNVSIEQVLHCKVHQFENLDAAIEYLLSTF